MNRIDGGNVMRSLLTNFQAWAWMCALVIAASATDGVAGDVTISTSSDPTATNEIVLSSRLARLLGQERRALSGVSVDRMRLITAAPVLSARPSKRGKTRDIPEISYTREWVANQPAATGGDDCHALSQGRSR